MDVQMALDAVKLTDELINQSMSYNLARIKSAEAKRDLDILLASKYLTAFRSIKSNLGYEMALLMLVEAEGEVGRELYSTYLTETARYKGMERILDAVQAKVSFFQSIMKYELEGSKGFKDFTNQL
jgi:hypothetical protein